MIWHLNVNLRIKKNKGRSTRQEMNKALKENIEKFIHRVSTSGYDE